MWSQRSDPLQHQRAVAQLLSVLGKPSAVATSAVVPIAGHATPVQVASFLRGKPGFVWLDGDTSRHFLLCDPLATLSSDGDVATVHGPNGSVQFPSSSLDLMQAALDAWGGPSGGTLAGFIGYDVASELEDIGYAKAERSEFPRLHFGLYDSALVAENGRWSIVGTDAWRPIPAREWQETLSSASTISWPPPNQRSLFADTLLDRAPRSFVTSVETIVRRIHAGDFFQTNLCRHFEAALEPDLAWPLYARMRQLNPSQYGAFLQLGAERALLSSSPEMFLSVAGGVVENRPIKGTRRRGQTQDEDRMLSEELLRSEKDAAELAMIVDVSRNDLSRVCEPGSVKVREHRSLLTLPSLHHTVSTIVGRLRSGATVVDLLRASFPPASITGAPKIAAIEAALAEEGRKRGPCMGSIGWIALDGRMELSVAIRTAFTNAGKITYLAGCGITADSVPSLELEESNIKAAAFLAALGVQA